MPVYFNHAIIMTLDSKKNIIVPIRGLMTFDAIIYTNNNRIVIFYRFIPVYT